MCWEEVASGFALTHRLSSSRCRSLSLMHAPSNRGYSTCPPLLSLPHSPNTPNTERR
jgi:hypothetical protein